MKIYDEQRDIWIDIPDHSIVVSAHSFTPDPIGAPSTFFVPETDAERRKRIKRQKRIDKLLAELESLGWEPPDRDDGDWDNYE